MARIARVMAVDTAYHVTQRGNARQFILKSDADRAAYLDYGSTPACMNSR